MTLDKGRPSIWFLGPWNHASGLGEAARGALRTLWSMSAELDVEAEGFSHFGLHERLGPHPRCSSTSTVAGSTLSWLHCNPDGASYSLTSDQRQRLRNSRYVVATWAWESQ